MSLLTRKWFIEKSAVAPLRPKLSQEDLLSSLKALAAVRHADVRIDIMQGLLQMLQGGGQALSGGWGVIVELLSSVPASMISYTAVMNSDGSVDDTSPVISGVDDDGGEESKAQSSVTGAWPRSSLLVAFSCMTLIVDDFLESLPVTVIRDLITGLSVFSAQSYDVNISLTSVEMLWKVTDYIMTSSREKGDEATTSSVLEVTMTRLLLLSMDSRPEVELLRLMQLTIIYSRKGRSVPLVNILLRIY